MNFVKSDHNSTGISALSRAYRLMAMLLTYPNHLMQMANRNSGAVDLACTFDVSLQPTFSVAVALGKKRAEIGGNNFLSYIFAVCGAPLS